jgi:hypothetical protein
VARPLRRRVLDDEPGWRTWGSRPSDLAIRDRIEAFFKAIHTGNFAEACLLCPFDDTAPTKMLEVLGSDGTIGDDDPRWYRHVTPPSGAEYENLDLIVPDADDGDGDVTANVFVDDEVSDVTAVFALIGGDRWTLAFTKLTR